MFDIATAPESAAAGPAVAAARPFDWRLWPASAPVAYPYTDYATPDARPAPGVQVLATYALALDDTLRTAIVLSLFSDARAGDDDPVPAGAPRRGWVGDEFMPPTVATAAGDPWGSRLWLVSAGKRTDDLLDRARWAAEDALAWLMRDGVAERVVVTSQWVGAVLAVRPAIYAPERPAPIYDVLWSTGVSRWGTGAAG